MSNPVEYWASELGLASRSLFPPAGNAAAPHFAMLDGRRASFVLSSGATDISWEESRSWQWSADLSHHVIIAADEVAVRSGREPSVRRFKRGTVESQLGMFLEYLQSEQSDRLPDLIPFLIEEFLQTWSTLPTATTGPQALAVYLTALHAAGETHPEVLLNRDWRSRIAKRLGYDDQTINLVQDVEENALVRAVTMHKRAPLGLRIVPTLVLRHAGGRLFQEAHSYVETAQLGLFGDNVFDTVPAFSPSGAYFTPVPVARIIAEAVLLQWKTLPAELTIADYACGSAVFLVEALYVLEQMGFTGKVRIIGRDISASAVIMARTALSSAVLEMKGRMAVEIDVREGDVLQDSDLPEADAILMNPPFRSWEKMDKGERDWVSQQLAGLAKGRPDLSVAIIERALAHLKPNGVLGTLLPAGVLASDGLAAWRRRLAETAAPSLIAVLGEHGLFRHALVNIGALVLRKDTDGELQRNKRVTVAWASATEGAASATIRALRRNLVSPLQAPENRAVTWSVTPTTLQALATRVSWLPGPGILGRLREVVEINAGYQVEQLFDVRQAIRTGANDVFLLSSERLDQLPRGEQRFFIQAVVAQSFAEGAIIPSHYLFWPPDEWVHRDQVAAAVPTYFREYLTPNEPLLRSRKKIDPDRWWRLTWPRGWTLNRQPRLLSKRFGLYPAFAKDEQGTLAPVQANAWLPRERILQSRGRDEIRDVITTYWWLLNSRVAVALFREFCPNVAGGQLDLEHKYVRHVPLPDLQSRLIEDSELQTLVSSMRSEYGDSLPPVVARDEFAAAAYGTALEEWRHALSGV